MSETTPPYGETNQPDDETLLERWRRCRGTPADDAAGDAIAARLRQRGEELAELKRPPDYEALRNASPAVLLAMLNFWSKSAGIYYRERETARTRVQELEQALTNALDGWRADAEKLLAANEALSAATARAEAMEAGIRSVAKRATEVTATWLMEQQHGLSPDWIDSDQAGEAMNSIIDECVSAEMVAIRALDTPTEGGPPQ